MNFCNLYNLHREDPDTLIYKGIYCIPSLMEYLFSSKTRVKKFGLESIERRKEYI